jgi:pimeloyl-ACP methyl ester carboxylesterase
MPGRNILAVDLPGHGASVGESQQSIQAYASALLKFLDELEFDTAVLAGHSMGGAVAMRMGLDEPHRLSGLILVGTGAKLRVHPRLLEDCTGEETYPRVVSQVMAWSFSQQADQQLVKLAGERLQDIKHDVLLADFNACNDFDMRERVAEISAPTLIICGEEDQMTPIHFSEYLADQIPNSKLEVIPGAGHMVMLEKSQIVARLMANFLDGLGST